MTAMSFADTMDKEDEIGELGYPNQSPDRAPCTQYPGSGTLQAALMWNRLVHDWQ
jgi:hypothetical protein